MNLTKLDTYDYEVGDRYINIRIDDFSDPTIVDILSELDRSNGRVYVEGEYFLQTGYELKHHKGDVPYLTLYVTTLN